MPIIRAINLASVLPDLADLPGNRVLLAAFLAANGLLANISDLNDAEDIWLIKHLAMSGHLAH